MDGDQEAFTDKKADLLRCQHQVLVQLDNAPKKNEGVVVELFQLGWQALAFNVGDGQLVQAEGLQFCAYSGG